MGFWTGECFNLNEELGENIIPERYRAATDRKKEENGGGGLATVIYGWSSTKVEACLQNDKWVSSDRVLY